MINRIYFLTSEIIPFAETYPLATFSKEIPVIFNERKYDFRLMMPKYAFISERRYILREVIRLRDMELNYRNTTIKASVKSAFIPNTKVQVYFLEHDSYYSVAEQAIYADQTEHPPVCNSDRFGYFAAAALTTLKYLRWKPEVIIINDWQMSLIPLFIQSGIVEREYVEGVKILQLIHSKTDRSLFHTTEYQSIGIKSIDQSLPDSSGRIDCALAAMPFCHHTLLVDSKQNVSDQLLQSPAYAALAAQRPGRISAFQLAGQSPADWQSLADEIIRIIEGL